MASGHFGSVPCAFLEPPPLRGLEPPEASRKTRIARSTGVAGPVRPVLGQSLGHVLVGDSMKKAIEMI